MRAGAFDYINKTFRAWGRSMQCGGRSTLKESREKTVGANPSRGLANELRRAIDENELVVHISRRFRLNPDKWLASKPWFVGTIAAGASSAFGFRA